MEGSGKEIGAWTLFTQQSLILFGITPESFDRGRGHSSYMSLCATDVCSAPGVGETPC